MPTFALRSATRAIIQYDPNDSVQTYKYNLFFGSTAGEFTTLPPAASITFKALNVDWTYAPTVKAAAVLSYAPHGPFLYAGSVGTSNPSRFLWHDASSASSLVYAITSNSPGGGAADTITFALDQWSPDGGVTSGPMVTVPANVAVNTTITLTQSGYYALKAKTTIGGIVSVNNFAASFQAAGSVISHRALPGFEANVGAMESCRVNAVALMYTNTAAPNYRQGKVTGYQLPPGLDWQKVVAGIASKTNFLADLSESEELEALNGMYAYLRPTGLEDFNLVHDFEVTNGMITDSFYDLTKQSACLCICPVITNGNSAAGRDGYFSFFYGIEFKTSDTWRPLACPMESVDLYRRALEHLKGVQQFSENPLHLRDIWEGIKNGARSIVRGVQEYGPTVISAARAVAPLMGAML